MKEATYADQLCIDSCSRTFNDLNTTGTLSVFTNTKAAGFFMLICAACVPLLPLLKAVSRARPSEKRRMAWWDSRPLFQRLMNLSRWWSWWLSWQISVSSELFAEILSTLKGDFGCGGSFERSVAPKVALLLILLIYKHNVKGKLHSKISDLVGFFRRVRWWTSEVKIRTRTRSNRRTKMAKILGWWRSRYCITGARRQ